MSAVETQDRTPHGEVSNVSAEGHSETTDSSKIAHNSKIELLENHLCQFINAEIRTLSQGLVEQLEKHTAAHDKLKGNIGWQNDMIAKVLNLVREVTDIQVALLQVTEAGEGSSEGDDNSSDGGLVIGQKRKAGGQKEESLELLQSSMEWNRVQFAALDAAIGELRDNALVHWEEQDLDRETTKGRFLDLRRDISEMHWQQGQMLESELRRLSEAEQEQRIADVATLRLRLEVVEQQCAGIACSLARRHQAWNEEECSTERSRSPGRHRNGTSKVTSASAALGMQNDDGKAGISSARPNMPLSGRSATLSAVDVEAIAERMMEFTSELRAELKNEVNSRLSSSDMSANSESFLGSRFHQLMGEFDVRIRRLEVQKKPESNARCERPASKVNASPHNVAHGNLLHDVAVLSAHGSVSLLQEVHSARQGTHMPKLVMDEINHRQNASTDTACPSSSSPSLVEQSSAENNLGHSTSLPSIPTIDLRKAQELAAAAIGPSRRMHLASPHVVLSGVREVRSPRRSPTSNASDRNVMEREGLKSSQSAKVLVENQMHSGPQTQSTSQLGLQTKLGSCNAPVVHRPMPDGNPLLGRMVSGPVVTHAASANMSPVAPNVTPSPMATMSARTRMLPAKPPEGFLAYRTAPTRG